MENQSTQWIVYDGNCGTCLMAKKLFVGLKFIPESQCLNFHTLPARLSRKVELERFKHGMAYVDEGPGDTLYGLAGISRAFAAKYPVFNKLVPGSLLFRLLDYFYNALCHNRYYLFPIKRRFSCDCEPAFDLRFFRRWLGIGFVFSLLISMLFGLVLGKAMSADPTTMALQSGAIVGLVWGVSLGIARLAMSKEHFRKYARHLAVIFVVGVWVLVPVICFAWLPESLLLPLAVLSMAVSSLVMLRMHHQRIRFMGLAEKWTLSWFLATQTLGLSLAIHFQILTL